MHSCQNFILCNVCEPSGTNWNVCFFYGARVVNDRPEVWDILLQYLQPLTHCMIIGDFNQVERHEDKLSGSSTIHGWADFMTSRFNSNLIEVPFQGPRLTWANKQLGASLLLERLDRAYVSSSWLTIFSNHILYHEPIICSDQLQLSYMLLLITTPFPRDRISLNPGVYNIDKSFPLLKKFGRCNIVDL